MAGKQVLEVPLTNVGGSASCIAVSARGMDLQEALESFSTLIIEFQDEEEKTTWLRTLVQATYRASAPPSVSILGELNDDALELAEARAINTKMAELVVNGTLVEMKLSLYGKVRSLSNFSFFFFFLPISDSHTLQPFFSFYVLLNVFYMVAAILVRSFSLLANAVGCLNTLCDNGAFHLILFINL
nr:vacuolar protein sorting-associated protein 13A-like isoform X1 [Ipomoea batatas]